MHTYVLWCAWLYMCIHMNMGACTFLDTLAHVCDCGDHWAHVVYLSPYNQCL